MRTIPYIYIPGLAMLALGFAWSGATAAEKSAAAERSAAAEQSAAPEKSGENSRMMFMQTATSTTYKDSKLTLSSPSTVYFGDKPAPMAGHMSNQSFVKLWDSHKEAMEKNPPKAIMQCFGSDTGKAEHMEVTLENPRMENANLVYDVNAVNGTLPAKATQVAFFIEDPRMSPYGTGSQYFQAWGGGGGPYPERLLPNGQLTGPIPHSAQGGG